MGLQREHLAQSFQGLLGLAFLDETDNRIDDHDSEYHPRVHPVAEDGGDPSGSEEDINEGIVKMLEKPFQRPFFRGLRQPVGPQPFKPSGRLRRGQTITIAAEIRYDRIEWQCMRLGCILQLFIPVIHIGRIGFISRFLARS